ncbi:MAG: O-antigen/teichoic acid export membrane protein [Flavobacteriaceae bacterium]
MLKKFNNILSYLKKDFDFMELLKGSSISFFLKIIGMLFGYAVMIFVTRVYGAEEWGVYSLCFTILSIAILLPKFGFENSLVRIITELNFTSSKKEILNVLFKAILITVVISLIVIFLLNYFSGYIVSEILNQEELAVYIKPISIAIIPSVIIVIVSSTFQAFKKTMLFMFFKTALINIIFFILLITFHLQLWAISIFETYVLAIGISLIISIFFLRKTLKKIVIPKRNENKRYSFKSIINVSTPMLLSGSIALLMGWSDILILSHYGTTKDVGIYNSTLKLTAIALISLAAVNAVTTPKFVEFYTKKDFLSLQTIVQKSTKMMFFATAPMLILLIIFSKQILGFFGEEFIVGYLALIYLCISKFVNTISGSVGYIMQMTDQQKTYQNIILIAFFINVSLNFLLIPQYGFNGAAIATSIAMIFWNITLVFIIKKKLGFWTIYIPFITK